MRYILILAFATWAIAETSHDPAELLVKSASGSLSYELVNHSPYRIIGFQVHTQFTSGGFESLDCTVNAQVRNTKDLAVPGVCQLPIDPKTGKPISYESRIVRVDFANGIAWTPARAQ